MSLASLAEALPAGDSILLDTTVLIAYFTGAEAASPVAKHIIDQFVETGRNRAIVSTITALEVLVDPIKRSDDELYRNVAFFLLHTPHLQMASTTFEVAHEAAILRANHGFKAPDALIIATGYRAPVAHLVCNDEEWKKKLPAISGGPTVCYIEDHLALP